MTAKMLTGTAYIVVAPARQLCKDITFRRMTKNVPSTDADEIAIKINVTVPAALFNKPTISIVAQIPDDTAIAQEISAEVLDNIREVAEQCIGGRVEVQVVEPTRGDDE